MHGADATVINTTLYISGGVCSNNTINICEIYKYELDENQWSVLPRPPHYSGIPVNIDNKLTVIGGYDSITYQPTARVTTFSGNKWSDIYPNLSVARVWPAVVPYHRYVIVACGHSCDDTPLNTIELIDVTCTVSHWLTVNTRLPKPMYAISAAICEDSFTIVGYVG